VIFVPVPIHIAAVPFTTRFIAGKYDTVIDSVSVNWTDPQEFVAKTLNVVVTVKLPVGKLIDPPLPGTGDPTFVFPELFLN
jgi:hypothetical protein